MGIAAPEAGRHRDAFVALAVLGGPALALAWHGAQLAAGMPAPRTPPAWWFLAVAPVVEELAFRGAVMHWLERLRPRGASRVSFANAATSVLFAVCHVPTHGAVGAAATLLPSLLLGRLVERDGVIGPAIALHAWFNASFLLAAALVWR